MARLGMNSLINDARLFTNSGTADYQIGGVEYWTDDQIQEQFMKNHSRLIRASLRPIPTYENGQLVNKIFTLKRPVRGVFEGVDSGTAYWRVETNAGSVIPSANYTVSNEEHLVLDFTSSQTNTDLYLSAYYYNLPAVIASIWRVKAGHYSGRYDFETNDQKFNVSQAYRNAVQQAKEWEVRAGISVNFLQRVDLSNLF